MYYRYNGCNTVASIKCLKLLSYPYLLFLSSYDLAPILRSTIGFLASCKLICFCLEFNANSLSELLKIFLLKKISWFLILFHIIHIFDTILYYFFQL